MVVGYYSAAAAGKHLEDFERAKRGLELSYLWYDQAASGRSAETTMAAAISEFAPDLVLTYGSEPLRLVRNSSPRAHVAIMSVDLEHVPILRRVWFDLRFGAIRQKLWAMREAPRHLLLAVKTYFDVRSQYPKAAFVVNHAAHHARWHARRHGVPVLYTPNPLMEVGNQTRRASSDLPRFVLLGGIGGIATLTGLRWFADRVYPLLEPALIRGDFEVHLVGRGELGPVLERKLKHVVRRGYVERIEDVFAEATAVLVPTPITLGFRTRIVDAFRHGVTVVAHAANGVGMPELHHRENALVAKSPQAFAAAVHSLAEDASLGRHLGEVAVTQFREGMSSALVAKRILEFAERHQHQGRSGR